MARRQRAITLQVQPAQESEAQIGARLARATAVLMRIAARMEAASGQEPPEESDASPISPARPEETPVPRAA